IILDVDSYGGEVAGCFDACDVVMAARQQKPVWAICTEFAYSAAYALASQADQVIMPRTGGVGSIGVVVMHVDFSQELAARGITVTMIHAGARKIDGNPYQPLPDDVRETIQEEVEATRLLFAQIVARGRNLDVEAILATEADCCRAQDALALGLADAVLSPDEAVSAFRLALADDPVSLPLPTNG
ncbi:MAG: S49 family peptidase, partial [Chloroflexi bacterium]|nr:S49 family peptidase [Chloroflexota bacterium]